jgi:hypothetical protein
MKWVFPPNDRESQVQRSSIFGNPSVTPKTFLLRTLDGLVLVATYQSSVIRYCQSLVNGGKGRGPSGQVHHYFRLQGLGRAPELPRLGYLVILDIFRTFQFFDSDNFALC